MEIIIVTGMSGAGKSSALKLFEDMGYYAMDNIPPQLLPSFVDLVRNARQGIMRAAIGIDIRGGRFFEDLLQEIDALQGEDTAVKLLFLESTDDVLIRRYKALRRPHPLDKAGNIYDGIQREKAILGPFRSLADYVLDTSTFNLGQLKAAIEELFRDESELPKLLLNIGSFGYKHGIQLDADLVFDVRFIPNPFYVPELKDKIGKDAPVRDYIFSFEESNRFVTMTEELLLFLLPEYLKEGKRTLSIAFGCTGGKHRTVAMAERMAERMRAANYHVIIRHRDSRFWYR